jgi:hypothetical protein
VQCSLTILQLISRRGVQTNLSENNVTRICLISRTNDIRIIKPIVLDNPEGSIQMATTFDDPSLQNVTVRALLTDGQKILPLSEPIEARLGLGEIKPEVISSALK